ncbi:CHRD domain-containing protein [Duganella sp. CT11-25]|jgi:hypothetical protein|uniref:CHRD domain-containing protein n=1 Tax=unclassified Duganella TaxID=2636909 RepID=UPI0039AF1E68
MKKHTIALSLILSLGAALAQAGETKVVLSGAEETPAVTTNASGSGAITVAEGAGHAVSGSITTREVQATAAHIHAAAPGKSGPPVITLSKTGDNTWSVPAGATLNDEQYASYLAGNLYINVHSADHKPGEIRGQLRP